MARSGSRVGTFVPPGPHYITPLGRTLLLGRSEAAHIFVDDPNVSSLHAAIVTVDGGWQVRDLGSRNGTWVNGARVAEVFLRAGDVLKVGSTAFKLEPAASRDARPAPIEAGATLAVSMPADPADALLSATLQEPRAVSALLNLSSLVDVAESRAELVRDACSTIADVVAARSASLWGSGEPPAREACWGEERAAPSVRAELLAHATLRRQATSASLGGAAGFAAAVPLLARKSPMGVLFLERAAAFPRHDLELLSIFSTKLALALENDELTERLRRSNVHLEAEVARQTEALRRLSEQRRDLLGMVAHDVRGALTFVKLLADPQALAADGAKDPVALEALEQIARRAGKTVDLLASLLDTQSIEEGKIEVRLEAVDLVARVKDLLDPLEGWARSRSVTLHLEAGGPVVARTDPARFEQVIQNLVSNAIKNTSRGTITTTIEARDGRAHVRVADTGRGIPREMLAQLFKPVSTADALTGRARIGLGLAIAHRLVTLLGGSIGVESTPGKGTTFAFDLPLSQK